MLLGSGHVHCSHPFLTYLVTWLPIGDWLPHHLKVSPREQFSLSFLFQSVDNSSQVGAIRGAEGAPKLTVCKCAPQQQHQLRTRANSPNRLLKCPVRKLVVGSARGKKPSWVFSAVVLCLCCCCYFNAVQPGANKCNEGEDEGVLPPLLSQRVRKRKFPWVMCLVISVCVCAHLCWKDWRRWWLFRAVPLVSASLTWAPSNIQAQKNVNSLNTHTFILHFFDQLMGWLVGN